ncbi:MAG: hypothetical protein IJH32_10275 [Ruminococcus sp.]|nr:hypothetical protein [Ruminococcus sp.]
MTNQKDSLAEDLIISKMKTLTEDIYMAVKELPCDQFGTVMSMLIAIWCANNDIDAELYVKTMAVAISNS